MKKVTLQVQINADSVDTLTGLLSELAGNIRAENERGKLVKDDGDSIAWKITSKAVS